MPRDEARRVLRVRWSRKPEVTDYKVDMRTIPGVVWRCGGGVEAAAGHITGK